MTRIVGKIYENTKEIKENNLRGAAAPRRGAAGGSAFVFFIFLSIFVYFANNPSHWDGNPGIGIVNPNNPKQSQSRQRPAFEVFDSFGVRECSHWIQVKIPCETLASGKWQPRSYPKCIIFVCWISLTVVCYKIFFTLNL